MYLIPIFEFMDCASQSILLFWISFNLTLGSCVISLILKAITHVRWCKENGMQLDRVFDTLTGQNLLFLMILFTFLLLNIVWEIRE